jgi:hypothetical protein
VKFGGEALRDIPLLSWCGEVLESVTAQPVRA